MSFVRTTLNGQKKIPNFDELAAFESFLFDFFGGPIINLIESSTLNYTELLTNKST